MESYRDDVLNEDSRHVLWCESPGCATGTGSRWEHLVKREAMRRHRELSPEYWLYSKAGFNELEGGEMTTRAKETNYKMPF